MCVLRCGESVSQLVKALRDDQRGHQSRDERKRRGQARNLRSVKLSLSILSDVEHSGTREKKSAQAVEGGGNQQHRVSLKKAQEPASPV